MVLVEKGARGGPVFVWLSPSQPRILQVKKRKEQKSGKQNSKTGTAKKTITLPVIFVFGFEPHVVL
jgi:hypothetical protein